MKCYITLFFIALFFYRAAFTNLLSIVLASYQPALLTIGHKSLQSAQISRIDMNEPDNWVFDKQHQ